MCGKADFLVGIMIISPSVTVTVVKLYKGAVEYLGLDVLAVNDQFQPQTHPDLFVFFQILLYLISLVALSGFLPDICSAVSNSLTDT